MLQGARVLANVVGLGELSICLGMSSMRVTIRG